MFSGDDVQLTSMMVHMSLGERKLDYYALQNSFEARVNPGRCILRRDKYGEAADLLDAEPHPLAAGQPLLNARPVAVQPAAVPYKYKTGDPDGEEDEDFAEHEYGYGEYDFRHPGTSWESDDEEERGDNEIFSPISTRAGQELGSILLVGKGGTPAVELKAAYDMQLSVRVDEKRLALCYDIFEHKGAAIDPIEGPLPSCRSYRRFEEATELGGRGAFDPYPQAG